MKLQSIILAMVFCVTSWIAHAQPIQGFYIGAGGGPLLPFGTRNTSLFSGIKGDFDIRQKLGYDTQLSAGYALGNGWRFELEGTYRRDAISGVAGTSFPASGSGTVRKLGVMVNALFDLDVGSPFVYPYMGLGAGYQSTHLDGFTLASTASPFMASASGEAGGFAAQAIGGLSFPIPNMPGLSITVDYRIMDILGGEKFSGSSSFGPGASVGGATKFHNQFDQSVMFGVRYAFNTPKPVAVALLEPTAGPPTQTQTFLVSFAAGDTTITGHGHEVVRAAAGASTRRLPIRIVVTGKADASGDPAGLSDRRAKAVAAALIGEGVPRNDIAIQPRGDAGTMQGPRVEIVAE